MSLSEILAILSSETERSRMRTNDRLRDILSGYVSTYRKMGRLCMEHRYAEYTVYIKPVSVVIDRKGIIYTWFTLGSFKDMSCISTGVPTYEEGSCLKDGHLEFYIDRDHEGTFYQNKKIGDKYQRKTLWNGVEGIIKLARDDPNLLLSTVETEISIVHQIRRSDVDFRLKRADYRLSFGAVATCEDSYMCFSLFSFATSPICISCSSRISDEDQLYQSISQNPLFQLNDDETLLFERIRAEYCIKLQILNPVGGRSLASGTYCGRPVIVQRIPMVNGFDSDSDSEELKALKSCGHLPCILGSFTVKDDHFEYRGSEPFLDSLEGYVTSSTHLPNKTLEDFMRDTTNALLSLHQLNIIHGDLQPSKVKICEGSSNDSLTAKVTGMTGGGSIADDFANLGHVIFFALTKGQFPFGDTLKEGTAIEKARSDLSNNHPDLYDLIFNVLLRNKSSPTVAEVSGHPFRFGPDECASFLIMSSDCIDTEKGHLLNAIQKLGRDVYGNNWGVTLNTGIVDALKYYDGYSYYSMRRLLRAMRNGMGHPEQIDHRILAVIGKTRGEIGNYYCTKLPKLLIKVYRVMQKHCETPLFVDTYFKWDKP